MLIEHSKDDTEVETKLPSDRRGKGTNKEKMSRRKRKRFLFSFPPTAKYKKKERRRGRTFFVPNLQWLGANTVQDG